VMDAEEFAKLKIPAGELFNQIVQASRAMQPRMQNAKLVGPIHATSDFSYRNRRFIGHRLLRVGDAAAFMDPIFSAGVYMAMYSGKLAANAVLESLKANDDGARRFRAYEKKVYDAMEFYWEMVEGFYTTPFMELFFAPREKYNLVSAVNAALAGDVDGGWKIRWRLKMFFFLVKLQSRWPLVPRISFDDVKS
jgi:flavin-dependent dehydrogenase